METVYPYVAGLVLTTTIEGKTVSLEVEKAFDITMCPVMLVRRSDTSETCILKVYDRRFGEVRKDDKKHTSSSDIAFKDYINSGQAQAALERFKDIDTGIVYLGGTEDFEEASPWNQLGLDECRTYYLAREMFTSECRAYQELVTLQGRSIPRFISTVTILSAEHPYLEISGIILEFIDGFTLKEMPLYVPEESWDTLVYAAMDIATKINHAGIIMADAGVLNTMIRRVLGGGYEPVLIDFGHAVFRSDFVLKDPVDGLNTFEECMDMYSDPVAIGGVMNKILQRKYKHSVSGMGRFCW